LRGRASRWPLPPAGALVAIAAAAACLLGAADLGAATGGAPQPFVPATLLEAAAANPDAVFPVVVQGRTSRTSASTAAGVAAERTMTPGQGRGVRRRFATVTGVAAELTGKQILSLARTPWVLAITPDLPMTAADAEPPPTVPLPTEPPPTQPPPPVPPPVEPPPAESPPLGPPPLGPPPVAPPPSEPAPAGSAAPTAVSPPVVTGTPTHGELLEASGGTWMSSGPLTFALRWQRCDPAGAGCVDLPDADASTYVVTPDDIGTTLRAVVTATGADVAADAPSAPTAVVRARAPTFVRAPGVVGTPEDGLMLTATEGSWKGTQPLAYEYRWQRCATGGTCADIPGAVAATYLAAAADIGSTLRVVVNAGNAAGRAAAFSASTAAVAEARPLSGYSTRQVWPYASMVAGSWSAAAAGGPAIAVVDSGIDAARADFGGRVSAEVTLTALEPNSEGDGRGHGTFVASVAAGGAVGYTGAYPGAKLVSLDVMDDTGKAMSSDVIAAADWIYRHKDEYDIRVANFSLVASAVSSFRFDPVDKAVEKLWLSGVVVIAAAGNYAVDGRESGVGFSPGNDPFVITVGATDVNGTVTTADDVAAPWSAYGYTVDGFAKPELGAPGRYMVGAVPPGSRLALEQPERLVAPGYMQLSGTSFAAPVVAGAAAYLLAVHPEWTPDQVKGALMLAAAPTASPEPRATGVGALDAVGAARVVNAPNPNLALNQFLAPDPEGGATPVLDEAAWAAAAAADPAWAASQWGSSQWESAAWSVAHWGAVVWDTAHWDSSHWGSDAGGSDTGGLGGESHWGTLADGAVADPPPAGGYWISAAERDVAARALAAIPAP
jgi:serine protease AprX